MLQYPCVQINIKIWGIMKVKYSKALDQGNWMRTRINLSKDVLIQIFRISKSSLTKIHQYTILISCCLYQKICRGKIVFFSEIGKVGKNEGILFRTSTRRCVLSVLQNLQSAGDPSACGYLHISWILSITTCLH